MTVLRDFFDRTLESKVMRDMAGLPPRVASPDTLWSSLRWRVAIKCFILGARIAPAGTARDRHGEYMCAWTRECREQWMLRYNPRRWEDENP